MTKMSTLSLHPHGLDDGAWSDLAALGDKLSVINTDRHKVIFARLPKATASGKSGVLIRAEADNGRVTVIEMTYEVFSAAARAFAAAEEAFPDGLPE